MTSKRVGIYEPITMKNEHVKWNVFLRECLSLFINTMEDTTLQREMSSESCNSSGSEEDEVVQVIQQLKNKGKHRAKKRGRRSVWEDHVVDDLADIICSNEMYTQKLVYENTKKTANTQLYENILFDLKERAVRNTRFFGGTGKK